jgi:dTDP-4-dehydrorhamnose reductase
MKILLLGKDGQLGWEMQRALAPLGELHACGRREADLSDPDGLRRLIESVRPEAIVNAAAYTAFDAAEAEPELAHAVNADAVGLLAQQARALDAWLIHYSTDYVFDGEQDTPYVEDDPPRPLSTYGRSKLAGEQQIRAAGVRHLIFRTSWLYGAHGTNFAKTMLRLAGEREELRVVADQFSAPTPASLIADVGALALYRVARMEGAALAGTYHLAAAGETSWYGYARTLLELARAAGWPLRAGPEQVRAITTADYPAAAPRPRYTRLDTRKLCTAFGLRMPPWQEGLRRLVAELKERA